MKMWRNWNLRQASLVRIYSGADTVQDSVVAPGKSKHAHTTPLTNSTPGCTPRTIESRRVLCTQVHGSIIHNSQNVKTI